MVANVCVYDHLRLQSDSVSRYTGAQKNDNARNLMPSNWLYTLLETGWFYQMVFIEYFFILSSLVAITNSSAMHCATNILSKGSRWINSNVDSTIVCSKVIGKISNPLSSTSWRKELNPFGNLNLSKLILIEISQIDATLTTLKLFGSSILIFTLFDN